MAMDMDMDKITAMHRNIEKNIVKSLIAVFFYCFIFVFAISQNDGPAGISNSSTLHVWLDAASITLNDTDPISQWNDLSGNNNHFTQPDASFQPGFRVNSTINSSPGVRFVSDFLYSSSISDLETNNLSWIIVFQTSNQYLQILLRSSYDLGALNSAGSNTFWGSYTNTSSINLTSSIRNSDNTLQTLNTNVGTSTNITTSISENSTSFRAYNNGSLISSITGNNSTPSNHNWVTLGANSNSLSPVYSPYIGYVSEVQIYSEALNEAKRIILDNYLSAKYNVSIGLADKFSYDLTHGNELAGIGREDASNEHLDAKGESIFRIIATSLDNGDYLLWGHNGADLTPTSTGVPTSFNALGRILQRVWRFEETGETGDLTFQIDVTDYGFGSLDYYKLLIDSDGDFTSGATVLDGINTSGNEIEFTVPSSSLSNGNFITIGHMTTEIISVSPTAWDNNSTWNCSCVPTSANDVTVDHAVTLSTPSVANSLTISSTGSLALSNMLDVESDITNRGAITSSGSRIFVGGSWDNSSGGSYTYSVGDSVTFDGATPSSITGDTDWNILTLDNPSGVSVSSGNQNIFQRLNIKSGTLTTNSNVKLVSNASGTAMLDNIESGAISGSLTVQRYLSLGPQGWRDITSPVQGSSILDWQNSGVIFSGFSGSSFPFFGWTNAYTYDETQVGSLDVGWTAVNDIGNSTGPTSAHRVFMDSSVNYTLEVSGVPYTGNTVLNLDLTGVSNNDNGWNFIGNPYPCTVRWNEISKTNVDNTYYVWNATLNNYGTFDGLNGTNGVDNNIASSQGFWVHATSSGASLTFNEDDKSSTDKAFIKSGSINSKMTISITNSINSFEDEIVLAFDSNSSIQYDVGLDVIKKFTENLDYAPSLYFPSDDSVSLCISYLNEDFNNEIPISVIPGILAQGNYTLNFSFPETFYESGCLFLTDLYNDSLVDLRINNNYNFNSSDTTLTNRFLIKFNKNFQSTSIPTSCYQSDDGSITVNGDSLIGKVLSLSNYNGFVLSSKTATANYLTFDSLYSGNYIVSSNFTSDCNINTDSIIIAESHILIPDFNISSDSVIVGNNPITLGFNNSTVGANSFIWDFGNGYSSTDENPTTTYFSTGNYEIKLTAIDTNYNHCIYEENKTLIISDSLVVSIDESNFLTDVKVSFDGNNLIIKTDYEDDLNFSIFNILGQTIFTERFTGNRNVYLINSGVYLIRNQIYILNISNDTNESKSIKIIRL